MKEFSKCKNGQLVYSTSNEKIIIEKVKNIGKRIDNISYEDIMLNNFKIDFGEIDPDEKVNGLLGLRFFRKAEIVLDIADLITYKKK
ncbi:hypothetical protein [Clostridium butyricum]|uniref:hypothetical protein n=1 Tax=Clostridium butyricum TaxID=1492 RepID=UPI002915B6F8|nr:hypothetical protein [Clostridium butyricum]MDU5103089.1 hypothetical protein [Clostridium butyricum]